VFIVASDRNPLHYIPCHVPPPAIVNLRGPRVRVPGEVLSVLGGHTLIEQICHDRNPEAVRGEEVGSKGIGTLSLPKIRSEHTDDAVRRAAAVQRFARHVEVCEGSVRFYPTPNGVPHVTGCGRRVSSNRADYPLDIDMSVLPGRPGRAVGTACSSTRAIYGAERRKEGRGL